MVWKKAVKGHNNSLLHCRLWDMCGGKEDFFRGAEVPGRVDWVREGQEHHGLLTHRVRSLKMCERLALIWHSLTLAFFTQLGPGKLTSPSCWSSTSKTSSCRMWQTKVFGARRSIFNYLVAVFQRKQESVLPRQHDPAGQSASRFHRQKLWPQGPSPYWRHGGRLLGKGEVGGHHNWVSSEGTRILLFGVVYFVVQYPWVI